MGRTNVGRVLLGGIVAGLVYDVLGYIVDGVVLASRWDAGMKALGHGGLTTNQFVWFNVLGLVTGIVTIWIYAGIRPRYGAGAKTAALAGLAVWVVAILVPNASFMCVTGLFSHHLAVMTTAGGLGEILLAAIAGAALYKE